MKTDTNTTKEEEVKEDHPDVKKKPQLHNKGQGSKVNEKDKKREEKLCRVTLSKMRG